MSGNTNTGSKMARRRGFISSLLCCFRPSALGAGNGPRHGGPSSSVRDANGADGNQNGSSWVPKVRLQQQTPLHDDDDRETRENDACDSLDTDDRDTESLNPVPLASQGLLLPPQRSQDSNKLCLVIDLDETLVHSSFKPISNADFIVPVEIDGTVHQVYVLKRPYVDEFLQKMGQLYECILFTASLAKYADPVADLLDRWGVFRGRLFRESCVFYRGNYVKDLSKLGRDLSRVVIVDNSPASYIFHPENAVGVSSWFEDMGDTALRDLIPFFEKLAKVESVYSILRNANQMLPPSVTTPQVTRASTPPPLSSSPITQVLPTEYQNNPTNSSTSDNQASETDIVERLNAKNETTCSNAVNSGNQVTADGSVFIARIEQRMYSLSTSGPDDVDIKLPPASHSSHNSNAISTTRNSYSKQYQYNLTSATSSNTAASVDGTNGNNNSSGAINSSTSCGGNGTLIELDGTESSVALTPTNSQTSNTNNPTTVPPPPLL